MGGTVSDEPELLDGARFAKSAASTGEEAQLTCRARGTPNVTFEWSREGDVIEADAEEYSFTYSQVSKANKVMFLVVFVFSFCVCAKKYGR